MDKTMRTELPKLAFDDIPTPSADAVSITGLVKNHGRIRRADYQPERGRLHGKSRRDTRRGNRSPQRHGISKNTAR